MIGGQFHDVLSGTCTPRSYEFSWNDEVLALKHFADGAADAIGTVARGMNTETTGHTCRRLQPALDRQGGGR